MNPLAQRVDPVRLGTGDDYYLFYALVKSSIMQAPSSQPRAPRRRRQRNQRNGSEMNMLTGGSRDVKPELLSYSAVESAADTTTTLQTPLPVLRNFTSGNGSRAQVVEILKVFFEFPAFDTALTSSQSCSCYVGTKNFAAVAVNFAEPTIFAGAQIRSQFATAVGATGPTLQTVVMDVTDGDGNGILVATDNIFTQIQSTATGATLTVRVKVLYRVFAAGVLEYVGIVQGQQ